jgi:hypothetical protein
MKVVGRSTQRRGISAFLKMEGRGGMEINSCSPPPLAIDAPLPSRRLGSKRARNLMDSWRPRSLTTHGDRGMRRRVGIEYLGYLRLYTNTFKFRMPYEKSYQLTRRQFPLRLAYAMTYNKSQSQTFSKSPSQHYFTTI